MKNLKKLFLLFALSIGSLSFAQTSGGGTATIDGNYCLVLDAETEVQTLYTADATALNWSSAADAKKKCGFESNNLVTFEPDYANNKIIIHIHTDRTYEPQDVAWWNEYLNSICQ